MIREDPDLQPPRAALNGAGRVLPFRTRQEFARRELARICEAHERWLLRKWSLPPGAPLEEPPCNDFALGAFIETALRWRRRTLRTFETVERTAPPHPLWRMACVCGHGVDLMLKGLQTTLLVYFAALGLTAFPLFARGQWVGGVVMTAVGSLFGWLLLARRQRLAVDDI
jgi:hypothetical protein